MPSVVFQGAPASLAGNKPSPCLAEAQPLFGSKLAPASFASSFKAPVLPLQKPLWDIAMAWARAPAFHPAFFSTSRFLSCTDGLYLQALQGNI
eukprot:scaffold94495_cov14-Tisochrysis_lutea.AAC.1